MFCIDVSFIISIISFFISFISFDSLQSSEKKRHFLLIHWPFPCIVCKRLVTFPSLIPAKSTLRRLQRPALLSTLESLKTEVYYLTCRNAIAVK